MKIKLTMIPTRIRLFSNETFQEIRVLKDENGNPWFVGKDAAKAFGYRNSRKALKYHVNEEDKGVAIPIAPGGKQQMVVINESGLYALIFSSQLEGAKNFKHWVTSEVLPQICTTGVYIPTQDYNNRPTPNPSH